jgi:Domain of unknown function (DUF6867)
MQDLLGTTWPVFLFVTVIVIGFAGFMTGQALANTWRPMWQCLPYCLLLGCADRFLIWGLFAGDLWSLTAYLINTAFLSLLALLAYRLALTRNMVSQYPWIYEQTGPLSWRKKEP